MRVIVTGSAGYLGSCLCAELICRGYDVLGIDNYSNSRVSTHKKLLDYSYNSKGFFHYISGNIQDVSFENVLGGYDAIVHMAGYKIPSESLKYPFYYFDNNISSTISVCKLADKLKVPRIIFSSSAAVYDENVPQPCTEDSMVNPKTIYGETKYISERILESYSLQNNKTVISLRYFNPIGCHSSGIFGDDPMLPPINLMSHILKSAYNNEPFNIYGSDYDTKDGTCIRDFIHVMDLIDGHILSLESSIVSNYTVINLGTGVPHTVGDIVSTFKETTSTDFPVYMLERRTGDLPISISSIDKAKDLLKFSPSRDLKDICTDSWKYYKKESD